MKKHLCFIAIFLLFLSSCGQQTKYVIKNKKVYYQSWNEGVGNYEVQLKDASWKTFKEIKTDCNGLFGKDHQSVFMDYSKIDNADAQSFEYVGNYYFKSKDSVYFFGAYHFEDECEVVGADSKTFRIDKIYPWAYDKQHVIYEHTLIDSVDFKSFEVIDEYNAIDQFAKYIEGERIPIHKK